MRNLVLNVAIAFAVAGLIGSLFFGGSVIWCTTTLQPIAPGLLTSMIRSMVLAVAGMFFLVARTRYRLERY